MQELWKSSCLFAFIIDVEPSQISTLKVILDNFRA